MWLWEKQREGSGMGTGGGNTWTWIFGLLIRTHCQAQRVRSLAIECHKKRFEARRRVALMPGWPGCTVKNAVELLGAFCPDVEKIQYH